MAKVLYDSLEDAIKDNLSPEAVMDIARRVMNAAPETFQDDSTREEVRRFARRLIEECLGGRASDNPKKG